MTNVNTVTIEAMEAQLTIVNKETATLNEMFAAFKAQSIVTETVTEVEVNEEAENLSAFAQMEEDMSEADSEEKASQVSEESKDFLSDIGKNGIEYLDGDENDEDDDEENEVIEKEERKASDMAHIEEQRNEEDVESNMQDMQDAGAVNALAQELSKQAPVETPVVEKKPLSILDKVKIPGVTQEESMDDLIASYAKNPVVKEEVASVKEEVKEPVKQDTPVEVKEEVKQVSTPVTVAKANNVAVIAAPTELSSVFNSGRLSHHHQTGVFMKEVAHALHMTMLGMIQRGVDTFHVGEFNGLEVFAIPFVWKEIKKVHPHVKLILFTNKQHFQKYCDTLEEEKARNIFSPARMSLAIRSMADAIIEVNGNAYELRKAAVQGADNVIRFMPHGKEDVATRLYKKLRGAQVNICPWSLLATRRIGQEVVQKQFPASHDYNPVNMTEITAKQRAGLTN